MFNFSITNDTIKDVFTQELNSRCGWVKDEFEDNDLLIMRALLPQTDVVAPNDVLRNGLAIKSTEEEISIFPFIERKVCVNGAIFRMAVGSRILDRSSDANWSEVQIRKTIDECSQEEMFSKRVESIAQTMDRAVNSIGLTMLLNSNLHHRMSRRLTDRLTSLIEHRVEQEDLTEFGLMNAITSVARDSHDPGVRWNLEELGGRIGLGMVDIPKPKPIESARYVQETDVNGFLAKR